MFGQSGCIYVEVCTQILNNLHLPQKSSSTKERTTIRKYIDAAACSLRVFQAKKENFSEETIQIQLERQSLCKEEGPIQFVYEKTRTRFSCPPPPHTRLTTLSTSSEYNSTEASQDGDENKKEADNRIEKYRMQQPDKEYTNHRDHGQYYQQQQQ
ncbi:hypothetical protein CHS0354_039204 [Potamilus streckersoni]|uniref:Uncharacterized protein n=1 Tax=Potamilus streckersoni TaxID=2493646 RepID=A0AAE0WCD3_9BIVA|nr:hypothetical protein CHS0354_039204 [Potamilus streckersoni]